MLQATAPETAEIRSFLDISFCVLKYLNIIFSCFSTCRVLLSQFCNKRYLIGEEIWLKVNLSELRNTRKKT